MESARINTNPTTGQFLEEAPLATEAEGLWGNVSTRLEYLNTAIVLFLHNKLCWAPLGSDMNSPFQTQPQTLEGIPISALNLRGKAAAGRFKQPPFFWMRELTKLCGPSEFKITSPDFWKIGFAWRVSFIHLSIFLLRGGRVLVKNLDHDFKFTNIKSRKHVIGINIFCSQSDMMTLYRHSHLCCGRQQSSLHWWRPGRSRRGCCGFHRCILSNENCFYTRPVQTTVE